MIHNQNKYKHWTFSSNLSPDPGPCCARSYTIFAATFGTLQEIVVIVNMKSSVQNSKNFLLSRFQQIFRIKITRLKVYVKNVIINYIKILAEIFFLLIAHLNKSVHGIYYTPLNVLCFNQFWQLKIPLRPVYT